ncbi:MAG: hypothetical protein U0835_09030 [Isosphaeraceae bacterium]
MVDQAGAGPSRPLAQGGTELAALRARRDKTHRNLAGLKARNTEREAAVTSAKTNEAAGIARDRLVNALWRRGSRRNASRRSRP